MKLLSFSANGRDSWGARTEAGPGAGIVDLGARLDGRYPSLRAMLEADALPDARRAAEDAPADFAEGEIAYLPPIPDPEKIFALQLNYRTHIEELKDADIDIPIPDQYPSVFMRSRGSVVGHGAALWKPPESDQFDYEGELAVVIGRRCRRVPRETALEVVVGYAAFNEGSVRDWQLRAPQFTGGKNWERSGSFGPWLVTPDEAGDPAALHLVTRVNGEVVQQSPVSDLLFDVPELIAYLSTVCELAPGDVIVTGTPGRKSGTLMKRFLEPGDRVEVEIDRLGTLSNPVEAEPV